MKPVLLPARCGLNIIRIKNEKEPLFQTNGASYSWLYQAGRLNRYLQRKAWKQIQAPVLIFQSAEDHLVSKPEQVRFVVKLARRGLTSGTMIIVPGTKHEIYGSGSRILRGYWKRIFCISGRAAGGKEWFGEIIKIQGNYSADSIGNTREKRRWQS